MKLRELVGLARERLGERAGELKTREELEAALFGASVVEEAPPSPLVARRAGQAVVTKNFFSFPT